LVSGKALYALRLRDGYGPNHCLGVFTARGASIKLVLYVIFLTWPGTG
jgi:hypothetical protein